MGPILAAVVVTEIDSIERFPSAQKLCGYVGLCPSARSSGGKTFQGKLLPHCNKWLRWAFVEAAWVAIGCSAYVGDFYKRKRALGKKPDIGILATARLMARITWQLLTQRRGYTSVVETRCIVSLIDQEDVIERTCAISGSGKRGCACIAAPTRRAKRPSIRGSTTPSPTTRPNRSWRSICRAIRSDRPGCAQHRGHDRARACLDHGQRKR